MTQLRVLLGFAGSSDGDLVETAGHVSAGMADSAAYSTPPVTMAALNAQIAAFNGAIAAQAQGGTVATADKNQKREALIAMLRLLANYVQGACNNDLATLLSSGFEAVSTQRTHAPLEKPQVIRVDNGMSTQLVMRVKPVTNARSYEVRYSVNGNAPQQGGLFTSSREMAVTGLSPGTNYTLQVRAIGGSSGYSDWSDPVSHMSM